jgi:hypothetical protein
VSEPIRVRMTVSLGFAGANREDYEEFDREEWEEMTPDQREDVCWQITEEFAAGWVESWFEVED